MDSLSAEIVITIFNNLHFEEKLECMFVCRRWCQVLRNDCLFETIQLGMTSHFDVLNRRRNVIMKKTSTGPHSERRCKRFLINASWLYGDINVVTLATAYPNLSFLGACHNLVYKASAKSIKSGLFEGWKNNLKTLDYRSRKTRACVDILNQGVFKRLSMIKIKSVHGAPSRAFYSDLLLAFKNCPVLTSLTLHNLSFQMSQLETLHSNVPTLISLAICNAFCPATVKFDPRDIESAKQLKRLTVYLTKYIEIKPTLLEYFKLKYISLDHFQYAEQPERLSTTAQINHVTSTWTDLLPVIGPGLKICRINQKDGVVGMVHGLAENTTQLVDLSIDLDSSHQMMNTLVSEPAFCNVRVLSLRMLPSNFQLSMFKPLTQLKELVLDLFSEPCAHGTISLNAVADELPKSVESLFVKHGIVSVEESSKELHSNIKNLAVKLSKMTQQDIPIWLERYFPELKSLTLNLCTLPPTFELPNLHLDYFEFKPYVSFMDHITDISWLQLTVTGKAYYYQSLRCIEREHEKMPEYKDDRPLQEVLKPSDIGHRKAFLHFKCAGLETAYFHHYCLLF